MAEPMDGDDAGGAVERVYRGILGDLEHGRMVPGQRLVETELAGRYGVGRNAVREAIQRLAARGVVDLSRHRSPAIRRMDGDETLEVLDVAACMTAMVLRMAARGYDPARHDDALARAEAQLEQAASADEVGDFSRARRGLYRLLLDIGGNREMQRLFPAVGMDIVHAQYPTSQLRGIRIADYRAMLAAVRSRDPDRAEASAYRHVANVRTIIVARIEG